MPSMWAARTWLPLQVSRTRRIWMRRKFAERQRVPAFSGGCARGSWLVDLVGPFVNRAHQTQEVPRLAEKIVGAVSAE